MLGHKKKKKMTIKSIPLWSHDSWQPAGGARTKFLLKTRRRHLGEVNNQFWTWSPILKPVCLTSVVDGSCSMLFYSYNKTYCINTLITIHWFNIIVLLRYNISANLYSVYTILCTCFSFFLYIYKTDEIVSIHVCVCVFFSLRWVGTPLRLRLSYRYF